MRALALAWGLLGTAALAQTTEVELFTDKGDTFVKAGAQHGVQVGVELTILGDKIATTDERRRVGVGTVMEVWPTLCRLALDDAAKADKTAKRYVALSNGKVVTGAPVKADAKPAKAEPKGDGRKPLAAPPAPPPPPGLGGPGLSGHATFGGAGPWKLMRVWNDGDGSWSNCRMALMPGNRVYQMPKLRGRDVESVALSNFKWQGPEVDVDHTWLDVRCAEGSAKFTFPP
jgi:eukaryotic-like serine/threonine-protein kinase